jgi:cysteinyl-tRNA synthetase
MINKEKMSKSLGNFFLVRDVLKKFSPDTLRFFILNTDYQGPLDFSDAAMDEARRSLERIQNTVYEVQNRMRAPISNANPLPGVDERLKASLEKFQAAMDDNLHTREAIAEIFDLSHDVNRWLAEGDMPAEGWQKVLDLYETYSQIMGIRWTKESEGKLESDLLQLIVDIRNAVRKKKDFETSDLIRSRLKELGITIEDSKEGTKIKRIS